MNQKHYISSFLFILLSLTGFTQSNLVIDSVYFYDYSTNWDLNERVHYKYDASKNRISEKQFRYLITSQTWEVVDSISRYFEQNNQRIEKRLQYDHTLQQWIPSDSTAQIFDPLNRVIERIKYSYMRNAKRWKGEERTTFSYYKNTNEFTEQINYGWVRFTPTGNEWIANDKIVQNFDTNLDSLTEILMYERNAGTALSLATRLLYRKYDSNGNLLEIRDGESNKGSNASPLWSGLGYSYAFIYDNLNRLIRKEQYNWNFTTNTYDGYLAESFIYQGNTNQKDTSFNYFYNTTIANWELITRNIHQYNTKGVLESTIIDLLNSNNSLWDTYMLVEYDYNTFGESIGSQQALWDTTTQNWINHRRISFALQTPDNFERYLIIQDWQNNQWVNQYRWDYRKYNTAMKLIQSTRSQETWNSNTMTWDGTNNSPRDNYQYDPSNTYLEVYIEEQFNGTWQNERKEEYFWGQLTPFSTATTRITTTTNCTLQNPYPINSQIRCEDLEINEIYQLKVFDLMGREVYQHSFRGGNNLKMAKNLDSNLYIFIIQGREGIVFSDKVLIP